LNCASLSVILGLDPRSHWDAQSRRGAVIPSRKCGSSGQARGSPRDFELDEVSGRWGMVQSKPGTLSLRRQTRTGQNVSGAGNEKDRHHPSEQR
jgi:hypothetical protein